MLHHVHSEIHWEGKCRAAAPSAQWLQAQGQDQERWEAQASEQDGASSPGAGTEGIVAGAAFPSRVHLQCRAAEARAVLGRLGWFRGSLVAGGPKLSHSAWCPTASQGLWAKLCCVAGARQHLCSCQGLSQHLLCPAGGSRVGGDVKVWDPPTIP